MKNVIAGRLIVAKLRNKPSRFHSRPSVISLSSKPPRPMPATSSVARCEEPVDRYLIPYLVCFASHITKEFQFFTYQKLMARL